MATSLKAGTTGGAGETPNDTSEFDLNFIGPTSVKIKPGTCDPIRFEVVCQRRQSDLQHLIWNKVVIAVPNPLDPVFRVPIERTLVDKDSDAPVGKAPSKSALGADGGTWDVPFCAPGKYRITVTAIWQSAVTFARHLTVKTIDVNVIPA